MSSMILSGDTSGSVTVTVPAVAGTNTITLPAVTGTAVISGQNSAITAGTAVASTSGTSIDFTSIPSWVKRITVMFSQVSTNGSSAVMVQLGSGSATTSGYNGNAFGTSGASGGVNSITTGVACEDGGASGEARNGTFTITLLSSSSNTWAITTVMARKDGNNFGSGAGTIALSGTLDRVRVTTVNGTDTFDAGSINILYE